MKSTNVVVILCTIAIGVALTGCKKSEDATAANIASSVSSAVEAAASNEPLSAEPTKTEDGNTERLQGTMQVDAGEGMQSLRSMATLVDPELGKKTAERLGTAQGQKMLSDANANVKSAMGKSDAPQASMSDVQDMANSFAGRTVYTSEAMHVGLINAYTISLDAKSPSKPGVRMSIDIVVSDNDLSLKSAGLSYYPDSSKLMQTYDKKKIALTDITIDKLERKDENTFVISGRFKGTELVPGVLAKELKGKTLASVSGTFDFTEVPIREMKL